MQRQFNNRQQSGAIPDVIFVVLVVTGLTFALQQFDSGTLFRLFALQPLVSPQGLQFPQFYPWQLVSYAFLHDPRNLMHILFNMLMFWMFGREIERLMGRTRFLTYYIACVVGAAIVQLLVGVLQGYGVPTIGASGGVYGILLAYGMAFPNRTIMLMIPPIPMKAKYFVILLGIFEFTLGMSGAAPGVANFAHLGGMVFGYLLIRYWRSARRQ